MYDSASEEPDSPDIQEFSSELESSRGAAFITGTAKVLNEPATIRVCAETLMHTQMQMAKSPRTPTKNVPVTGQQVSATNDDNISRAVNKRKLVLSNERDRKKMDTKISP